MRAFRVLFTLIVMFGALLFLALPSRSQAPPQPGAPIPTTLAPAAGATTTPASTADKAVQGAAAQAAGAPAAATQGGGAQGATTTQAAAAAQGAQGAGAQGAGTLPTPPAATTKEKGWNFEGHWWAIGCFSGALLLFLIGAAVLLFYAGKMPETPYIAKLTASFFFWLGMSYAVVLLILAVLYNIVWEGNSPYLFGGVLPIAVAWFGALGAVTISLEGVFHYSTANWNKEFNYWHLGRPVFGAVLGIVAFFMFVLIVSSAGTPPSFLQNACTPGQGPCTPAKDFIVYYVLAFLVGYREETFRELIRRVTDLILKPGTSADAPAVTFKSDGKPISTSDFGTVTRGQTKTMSVEIVNSGKATLTSPMVTLDKASSPAFSIPTNVLAGVTELKPGQSVSVEVTFSPTATEPPPPQAHATGVLIATGMNLASGSRLSLSGTAV